MQNTITARRISYNLIAFIVMLAAVAMLVGFVAGLAVGKPGANSATAPAAPAQAQTNLPRVVSANAPIEGWIFQQDSGTNEWYAYHYSSSSMSGLVIDASYELRSKLEGISGGCGLNRNEPDC